MAPPMTPALTSEQLHDLFRFDEESGVLYWRRHPSIRHPNLAGIPAGYINSRGVRVVRIFGRRYRTDSIAWFFIAGQWPEYVRPEKSVVDLYDLDLSGFTL